MTQPQCHCVFRPTLFDAFFQPAVSDPGSLHCQKAAFRQPTTGQIPIQRPQTQELGPAKAVKPQRSKEGQGAVKGPREEPETVQEKLLYLWGVPVLLRTPVIALLPSSSSEAVISEDPSEETARLEPLRSKSRGLLKMQAEKFWPVLKEPLEMAALASHSEASRPEEPSSTSVLVAGTHEGARSKQCQPPKTRAGLSTRDHGHTNQGSGSSN